MLCLFKLLHYINSRPTRAKAAGEPVYEINDDAVSAEWRIRNVGYDENDDVVTRFSRITLKC